ncbi:hypothetical protein KQH50_00810 [bacterium]|nr:hypothetical protein [bacterium]
MSGTTPGEDPREKLERRRKVVGVLYRVLLILGMLSFPLFAILILFTVQFRWWGILFPIGLISLGVLLAWLEYGLYQRL